MAERPQFFWYSAVSNDFLACWNTKGLSATKLVSTKEAEAVPAANIMAATANATALFVDLVLVVCFSSVTTYS